MTPGVFLSRTVILFSLLCTLIIPVHGQDNAVSAENKKLYDQLAYQDSVLFSIVYTCQPEKAEKFFTDDMEFYHDKGGPTIGRQAFLESLKKNFCGPNAVKLRREVVKGTMHVYPMANYGAIQTGEHRFYITEPGKPEKLSGIATFTHLWKLVNNEWKITRILSYNHHEAENSENSSSASSNNQGTKESIYSDILKENRTIEVVLPQGFQQDTKHDVLYVLDGEGNTGMTKQIEEWVKESGFMPEPIIVGVYNATNSSRNRDFTPTPSSPGDINSGGADNFLSFLQNELIPYINKKYSVKGSNGIFGHSLGGLFAMYAFLTRPQVFDSYLAADPSFWWDNRYIRQLTLDKLDPKLHSNKSLWMSGRGGKESEDMGIPSIDSILKAKAPKSLQWKFVEYPGETHNSIRYKSVYDGLRFFYTGFNASLTFHPQGGFVENGKPFKVWFFTPADGSVRYTTDGSEPTLSSPLAEPEITLNGPGQLTIKSFSPRGAYDRIIKVDFKPSTLKSVPKPKNAKPGGLRYNYYEGAWDSLPDFSKMKPVLTGIMDKDFTWSKLPRKINWGARMDGYLEIKEDGYYTFGLSSDDGSKLYIGNQLLINADGLHGSEDHSGIVSLQKGFYPIRVDYFQREGGMNINLIYVTPSAGGPKPIQIPPELLYSN
jgi:predicted alpha/beta superfamily hydrolase